MLLGGGGYYVKQKWFTAATATRYVTGKVERGVLTTSVSGTGQVSASLQVDLKSKVSGEVVYVGVKQGQDVKLGTIIAQIDAKDAQKTARDAETSLETAKLSLEDLLAPADTLSVLQSENALISAQQSKEKAEDDLAKSYDDAVNTAADAFLELPTIMTGLHDILLGYTLSSSQQNMDYYVNAVQTYDSGVAQYRDDAYTAYQKARSAYEKNFIDYKATSRFSDVGVIEALIDESYETTRDIAEAVKSTVNLIRFYEDKVTERGFKPLAIADTHLAGLSTYTSKINAQVSNFSSIRQTIKTDKKTIIDSGRTIVEKTESLARLKAGADDLDIRAQKITVQQKEDALLDARQKLTDYYIRALFDGVVAALDIKKGDDASSGTAMASLITKQRVATISLNEVDIAKVRVGQKATITFDAVDGLNITGEVAEIDTLGTVSQGVVSYKVKIVFDVQDDRVKPGMTLSTSIILTSKQDVLVVSNSAIKIQGNENYVEILVNGVPQKKIVTVGDSNDLQSEITNGLTDGEEIITQKITTGSTAAPSGNSPTQGGGAFRMLR